MYCREFIVVFHERDKEHCKWLRECSKRQLENNQEELLKALKSFLNISYSTDDENYPEIESSIEKANELIRSIEAK